MNRDYLCITYSYLYITFLYIFLINYIFKLNLKRSLIIKLLSPIIKLKLDNLENNFLYLTLLLKSI